jgi:hypothetical protein
VTHPNTGEKAHLIGLWVVDPRGGGDEIGKSLWYLGRYADGEWTNFETGDSALWAENLVALSDRTVCIAPYLTCFDATGTIAETLPGVWFDDIDIAPDGAVWVHGEQIARLPDGALQ